MELRGYILKHIFFLFFAAFSIAIGWSSEVAAAQPNDLIKALNNADRAFCRSLKTKCKVRGKAPAVQRQKPSTEKPPIPVQKPLIAQHVAAPAPIPREKPQNLQKETARLPEESQSGKVDKLASATPLSAQRPVIAPKVEVPVPLPRAKPRALQKQAAIIPRVLPRETLEPSDKSDTCLQKLRAAGADFAIPAGNVDYGKCHVQSPVNLIALRAQGSSIKFPDAPLLNCKFALQFSKWLSESGAPILAAQMNSPVEKISTGPGFECRGRNGDGSAKISEHGYGNAVDIATFRLRNGKTLDVADSTLLRGVRSSACGYFTTVLGPGSNSAHEKHIHFDLGAHGKSGNYRICE